jgi:hypothetical protein
VKNKELVQQLNLYQNQLEEAEKLRKDLVSAREQVGEELDSEPVPTDKSSFRVELYSHEDKVRGKIEHLLSKDKARFDNVDSVVISDFISSHLPFMVPEETTGLPVDRTPGKEQSKQSKTDIGFKRIETFRINPLHEHSRENRIQTGEQFEVEVTMQPLNGLKNKMEAVDYVALLYARSLEDGSCDLIGKAEGGISSDENLSIKIAARALSPGIYRLDGAITLNIAGQQVPAAAFRENELIYVY